MASSIRSATEVSGRVLATVLSLALALGPNVARAASADETKAKALFADGMKAYDVGDFEGALSKYSDAYKLAPLPGFLFNLGQCHRQLGNFERAAFFYGRFIELSKPGASNVELATQLRDEMKAKQVQKEAEDAKKAQEEEAAKKREAARNEELKHVADAPLANNLLPPPNDLPPAPPPPAVEETPAYKKWWFWTLIGAGVVTAAVGTVGVLAAAQPKQQPARPTNLTPIGSH